MAKNSEEVKKALEAYGAMAEMGLAFYRAALGAGASSTEALNLTMAYYGGMFRGRDPRPPESEEE